MQTTSFFNQLLNISSPFKVDSVAYKEDSEAEQGQQSVHISISVDTSAAHRPSSHIIQGYQDRTWRHLNLFQYPCYIHCKVPKYKDKVTGKVKTLQVPWAREGSGFTLLFEAFALDLVRIHGCVSEVSRQLCIYPQRLWHIMKGYCKKTTVQKIDMSKVEKIGLDETSRKKGHDYITCFLDLQTGGLLYVVEGKSSQTIDAFANHANDQGLDKDSVTDVSIDMSPAFIAGVEHVFTNARITFDKFHVSQLVQKAFDKIRKSFGRKEGGSINKWLFFKPYASLTQLEQETLDDLLVKYPVLDMVYELKNEFKTLWQQPDKCKASAFLSYWTDIIRTFKKKALTTLANTLDKHHQRIVQVIESQINNAILEGFNAKIQAMKTKARGYRNVDNLILMVHLHCAK